MSTILILGATSDMAWATAKQFAEHGHSVILSARNTEPLKAMSSDLKIRYGVAVDIVSFDATDHESHPTYFESLNLQPDVVACFFGYLGEQQKAQEDWSEAEKIISANYTGAVSILNAAANYLLKKGKGSIIGVSSVAGDRGRMSNYIYGSAKAGFTAYLSGLRNRMHHYDIHVLTVKPGFVYTRMTEGLPLPKALTATPAEVANDIYNAYKNRKNVTYTKWFWRYILLIITLIPEAIFKKLKL